MASNKDFVTMKTDVSDFVGDTSTSFAVKIGKWLNARFRDIYRRYLWKGIFNTYTFTTTANLATYPLPYDFGELWYLYDNTNKTTLFERPEIGPQNDTSLVGASQYFSIKQSSVQDQPTSASVLAFVSDSAADTTQTIFIRGTSGGFEKTETFLMTGTTPVNSANSYTAVTHISKSGTSTGGITVTSNSGAVTLAAIQPGQLQARYRILHLYYIPVASVSMVVRYKREMLPMVNDYDYPVLDFADEAVLGAQADAWRAKRQFSKSAAMEGQYEQAIAFRMFQEEQNRDISIDPTPYQRDLDLNANSN